MNIAFTGHRPNGLHSYDKENEGNQKIIAWLEHHISRLVNKYKQVHFITGGALGVDQWAAEIVHRIRDQRADDNVLSTIAIPCRGQDAAWSKESRELYERLLLTADDVHYVYDGTYYAGCMQKRNEWMVDHANGLIAVWNRQERGGTYNCVNYALKQNVPILGYHPIEHVQYTFKKK